MSSTGIYLFLVYQLSLRSIFLYIKWYICGALHVKSIFKLIRSVFSLSSIVWSPLIVAYENHPTYSMFWFIVLSFRRPDFQPYFVQSIVSLTYESRAIIVYHSISCSTVWPARYSFWSLYFLVFSHKSTSLLSVHLYHLWHLQSIRLVCHSFVLFCQSIRSSSFFSSLTLDMSLSLSLSLLFFIQQLPLSNR